MQKERKTMSKLPAYLQFKTKGAARPENVFTTGNIRISVITPRLIRLEEGAWEDRASMTVLHRAFCDCQITDRSTDSELYIETEYLVISCRKDLALADGLIIKAKTNPAFIWHFGQKPLHNLGGTVSTLDCVDGACELEDGICSLDGFAFIDDSQTPVFDEEGWLVPRKKATDVYFFGYGHDYTACVQDYYRLTGKPEMLPAFVFGNWWSRYHAYTDKEYLDLMDRFDDKDIPLSVGIVDMDWHLTKGENWKPHHNGWTGYTWNEELFPDYKAFLNGLHKRGLRTALNLHPAMGVQSYEKQYPVVAKRMGIDPASEKTVPCDYLNPEYLKAYFEELHFPYEQDGIDFWWMDWQQGCDYSVVMGEDYQPNGLENVKPLWILNHLHYLAAKRNGKRGLIFSRFGGYGSQRYPIGFSGDTYISWSSLDFQPYFTATASNIGYGWWSHDIGGHHHGVRDDEMTARWIQFGVFSPIFRLHSTDSVFLGREPWNYNPRAEAVITRFMRLRHQMFPYLYTMCYRDCTQLLPLMRPMYHVHPECSEAYQVKNQYYFGSELIVAPITRKSDSSDLAGTNVWLPEGTWVDLFNGFIYKGNQMIEVFRPLETMPVFMKAGAIVPMQKHTPGSKKLGQAENMEIYVAPGADGYFRLYEDAGENLDYQNGAFCETPMCFHWFENKAEFRIAPAEGDTALIPGKRNWEIHFRGFRKGCCFAVNGKNAEVSYDPHTNTYTVAVTAVSADQGASIMVEHADSLIHDNSDCRDIAIDHLMRAQCALHLKDTLLKEFDRNMEEKAIKAPVRPVNCCCDQYPSLGGKLWELLEQLD